MTTYTVTTTQYVDELATKTGADIYNINGGTLIMDQDSRYGLNASTSASIDRVVISSTLGGTWRIDGRYVRLIPFTGGSGTITVGSTITMGSGSGKVIGIYTSLTTAPATTGASGWIKVNRWNGVSFPTSGSFTQAGFTFTINGADSAGWIEILTEEGTTAQPALSATVPRLGKLEVLGEWFDLGTTNGTANQTFQVPTNGLTTYIPGVFIEKSVGSGDYEFYAAAGTTTAIAADIRAKVVWTTTAGIIRLGHNGTANAGYTPVSGLKVRIGNVFTSHCTSAAKTANVTPNATAASRFEAGQSTGSGGVYTFDKCSINWYMNFSQCYQVNCSFTGINDLCVISENAAPIIWDTVGIGQSAAITNTALVLNYCYAGGTFTDCRFTSASRASSGNYIVSLQDAYSFTFTNVAVMCLAVKGNAGAGSWTLTRVKDSTWSSCHITEGKVLMTTCKNLTWTGTSYCDVPTGTTATTATQNNSVWEVATNCDTIKMDGLDFMGLTNVQPYIAILNILAAGCTGITLRNIGTSPSSQLSLGSVNQTGTICAVATSGAASNIRLQRIFASATRTNIYSGDNSTTGLTLENVMGDYADVPVANMLNVIHKGVGATPTYVAQTAVYGTIWWDHFTSATVGRIAILMNEPTALSAAQVTLTGGSAYTSGGTLYMPTIGMTATFEMPYFSLGHTQFANSALVMAGGTATNYTYAYQINTGSGFGAWSSELSATALGTALNGLGAINPATGFKLRLRITTSTTNSTAISSVYITTVSTAAAQANYYPLDTNTVTFTGFPSGTDVVVLSAGTSTILDSKDSVASPYGYTYSGAQNIDIGFIQPGYVPLYIRGLALGATDSSIPVSLTQDRNYQP